MVSLFRKGEWSVSSEFGLAEEEEEDGWWEEKCCFEN